MSPESMSELFHYQYLDAQGKKRRAVIQASNLAVAKNLLRAAHVTVLSLTPLKTNRERLFKRKEMGLSTPQLILFTTQLTQLLAAGIPLYESLVSLEEEYRSESYHPILLHLTEEIKKGNTLSAALRTFPSTFNSLYCSMIQAGESMGALHVTLEKLSQLLIRQSRFKKQITTALLYPLLLAAFSSLVIVLLLTFVIPSLETLFEGRAVNGFTAFIMQISRALRTYWHLLLPLLFVTVGTSIYLWSVQTIRDRLKNSLLKIPLIKTVLIQTAIARFARSCGSLLQSGIPLLESLNMGRQLMRQPLLEEVIEKAQARIIEGSLLSIELKKSPLIPSLVSRMLSVGEEGGNTGIMMHKIADLYEEEVEKNYGRALALVQPLILILMGVIVGVVMLAVLLPLTDMNAFL